MVALLAGPSQLLTTNPNITISGSATPLMVADFVADRIDLVNNDTAARAFRLYRRMDDGITWEIFSRISGVAVGASVSFPFGGIRFIGGIAVSPNGATTAGLAAFVYGWPIW